MAAPDDLAQCLAEPGVLAGILQGDRTPQLTQAIALLKSSDSNCAAPLTQAIADNMKSRVVGKDIA